MNLTSSLTTIAIGGASGASILILIDWFLSDQQRRMLSDTSIKIWNWIDEVQRKKFIDRLFGRKARVILAISAQAVGIIIVSRSLLEEGSFSFDTDLLARVLAVLVGSSVGIFVTNKFLLRPVQQWLNRAQNQFYYVLRTWIISAAFNIVSISVAFPLTLVNVERYEPARLAILGILGLLLPGMLTFTLVFILSAFVILTIQLLKIALWLSETIFRRIAESPKGPLLSGSALIGGIAALVKTFQ